VVLKCVKHDLPCVVVVHGEYGYRLKFVRAKLFEG
jgi:hypothetical protein